MYRPGDLSKAILCLMAPRSKHSALIVRGKQHNYSAIAAPTENKQEGIIKKSSSEKPCKNISVIESRIDHTVIKV